jgi:hypothetical protein
MRCNRLIIAGRKAKAVAILSLCFVLLLSACDSIEGLLSAILPDPGPDYNAAEEMRRGQENFANIFGQGDGQSSGDLDFPNTSDADGGEFVGFDGVATSF